MGCYCMGCYCILTAIGISVALHHACGLPRPWMKCMAQGMGLHRNAAKRPPHLHTHTHTPIVLTGAVPLLVLAVQEPELNLKRVAASALSDLAKHSPELGQVVVDAGGVSYLAPLLTHSDAKLKRQV